MNWLRKHFSRRKTTPRNRVGVEFLEHRLCLSISAAQLDNTPALYNPATGFFYLRNENAGGVADTAFNFGAGGQGLLPIAGDWNGDGVDSVGVFDPNSSTFFLRNQNAAGIADVIVNFGAAGANQVPVVGDWDGDGVVTVGLYNPTTGTFFLRNQNAGGIADNFFSFGPGGAGWQPLVGDWNNDGVDTIGAYDPATGTYHMRDSNSAGFATTSVQFGPGGGMPLSGDWNGDGVDTFALLAPSTSTFNLRNVDLPGVADLAFNYGPAGTNWLPLAGQWIFDPFDTQGGIYTTPGNANQAVPTKFTLVAEVSSYSNEMGLFLVDSQGRVGGLSPGDAGYAQAALSSPTRQVIFNGAAKTGAMSTVNIPGGSHYALYLIQDNNTATFLAFNPSNSNSAIPRAFFSLAAANPDGVDHVKNLAPIVFAWEDGTFGGDGDFNDEIVLFQYGRPFAANIADTTAPLVSIISPANGSTITTNVAVMGQVTDDRTGVTAQASIDGGAPFALTLSPSGGYSFNTNFALDGSADGPHNVVVTATDTSGNTSTAQTNFTLDVAVTPPNTPPVANADAYTGTQGQVLAVDTVMGLLANDSDADGDTLTAALVGTPANGTVVVNGSGAFQYTPNAGFSGTDTFTYQANDGADNSAVATVTITVTPTGGNQAPTGVADAFSVDQGGTLNVPAPGVLTNDTDPENDPLQANLQTSTTSGTLTLNPDGSFTYTPNPTFSGSDSFVYRADDGSNLSANTTVTITVNPVTPNTPPVAVPETFDVNEGDTLTVPAPGVLTNDTDVDGDPLTAVLVSTTANGTLALSADGSFTYAPNAGFTGVDTFVYQANDGADNSASATVTINVNAVNVLPVAVADNFTVDEDGTLTEVAPGVLGNDVDADGDTLSAILVSTTANGTLNFNSDGSFTYMPNPDFNGADGFTYQADDGAGSSNITTVTITVNPTPDDPVANPDDFAVDEGGMLIEAAPGVLLNDTDADNDPLTAVLVTTTVNGTLNLASDGSFDYTPTDPNFNGTDSFTYAASDDGGVTQSAPTTVTITINPVNDAPTANDDAYAARTGIDLVVDAATGVLANDTDPELDPLTVDITMVTQPTNGIVTLNDDGSFTYQSNAGFSGDDTFTYVATDGTDNSNTATVTITVSPENAPTAADDTFSVEQDMPLSILAPGVLANDMDADLDPITAELVTTTTNGALTLNPDGSFDYQPDPGFVGTDTFTYTANDGFLDSNVATVTITVTAPNQAPVGQPDFYTTDEGATLDTTADPANGVLANDDDPDDAPNATLTAVKLTDPVNGTLTVFNADGTFIYTPTDPNFNGTDTFTYAAFDGAVQSAPVTVTITITAVNDDPVGNADTYNLPDNISAFTVDAASGVLANDTDADGDMLMAFDDFNGPFLGTLILNSDGSFTYTPDGSMPGTGTTDTFSYSVSDGTTTVFNIMVTLVYP